MTNTADQTNNFVRLMRQVEDRSECKVWDAMTAEWTVSRYHPRDEGEGPIDCVCGHRNIVHCYTIKNTVTGRVLNPIGSQCIERFNNPRLVAEAKRRLMEWKERQRAIEQARIAEEDRLERARSEAARIEARRVARRTAEGERVMTFGKFQGRTFAWVAHRHPWYIDFCRENARRQELADLVAYASDV